jgi:hypothetical protein
MVCVVPAGKATAVVKRLVKAGEKAWIVGESIKRERGKPCQILVRDGADSCVLSY